jgi:hypothetical protein
MGDQIDSLLQTLIPLLGTATLALLTFAVNEIKRYFKLKQDGVIVALLNDATRRGTRYAEERAHKWVKEHGPGARIDERISNGDWKLRIATDFAVKHMGKAAAKVDRQDVQNMIESQVAKLKNRA